MKDTACLLHGAPPEIIYRCWKTRTRYDEAKDLLVSEARKSPLLKAKKPSECVGARSGPSNFP
ncbi:hypothetical protein DK872_26800 [Kosakonia sp. MH5]|nr:hypothetical protein [Kosakonia sp. MH5]